MAATPQESSFGRGAIVRVKLFQFLTYGRCDGRPDATPSGPSLRRWNSGPGLNVVMGPNGTGKSSIVMAIAVGLGAAPNRRKGRHVHLDGRGGAVTELELLDDKHRTNGNHRAKDHALPTRHVGVEDRRQVGHGAEGAHGERPEIRIGNLCTFLPQEKVDEFRLF